MSDVVPSKIGRAAKIVHRICTLQIFGYIRTVRDRRIDANTRWGQISSYYFFDDYRVDNPYPGQQGGASVPGFDALTFGKAQLASLEDVKTFGSATANEFHAGFLRYANVIGQPHGGLGVSLAEQGFTTPPGAPGFAIQAPQFEGIENIVFPSFVMGVPITNVAQTNNTLYLSDTLSKSIGSHTVKIGGQFHADQVNEHPNATFNGTFNINGTETGSAFADFLIGVPSNFTQSSGQPFYLRNRYEGLFAQDSWRAHPDLTINFGLRWALAEFKNKVIDKERSCTDSRWMNRLSRYIESERVRKNSCLRHFANTFRVSFWTTQAMFSNAYQHRCISKLHITPELSGQEPQCSCDFSQVSF